MTLKKYLGTTGISVIDFAARIGINRCSVYRYIEDGAIPSQRIMVAIYKQTKGDVAPNDFYPLPRPKKR